MNIAGFRLHELRGSPKRSSVYVTANYRITFGWSGESALDVDFEDYIPGEIIKEDICNYNTAW